MIGALLTFVAGATGGLSSLASLPVIGVAVSLFGTRAGRYLIVGGGAALVYAFAYWKGEASASGACEAQTLRAQLQAAAIDRDSANARASRAQLVIKGLQAAEEASRRRIDELNDELANRPLQPTTPGAKVDAKALLDDQCRYTPAGARRLRK